MARIGFVGPGQMGEPMVHRLLAAGHEVSVHARRPELRQELQAAGARVVDSPRDAAHGNGAVIACLFSDAQLVEACRGSDGILAGMASGAVLISHVTGQVATIQDLSDRAAVQAVPVVAAPVSGDPNDIRAGTLTVLLGGPPEATAIAEPIVTAYADNVITTGALGSAMQVKLLNNMLFASHLQLATAAIDLAKELGVTQQTLLAALAVCSGASYAAASLHQINDMALYEELAGPFLRKDAAAFEREFDGRKGAAEYLFNVIQRGPMTALVPAAQAEAVPASDD